ncbi:MAG: rhodanese-like domain-containing protein [Synechococcales cyanobacterium C42_A2020_086]|jgi:rhodanese-related sulfurtransferase|nr:rhodanese-like domain-containing protein [Synechococcales cyanobacterium M58_A2018_015]MBF2076356.1 rhodanese-like domain-containing protein [Synechococcales cyanobacterium C42_A2020_086]
MLFGIIPTPPPLRANSRVYDLKARLDWGEPALTIIDVRPRSDFLFSRILGAINMPAPELVERALRSLELNRDIYVYSDADEETALAAARLRQAGFCNVSEVQGGLPAWRAMGYPIECGFRIAS